MDWHGVHLFQFMQNSRSGHWSARGGGALTVIAVWMTLRWRASKEKKGSTELIFLRRNNYCQLSDGSVGVFVKVELPRIYGRWRLRNHEWHPTMGGWWFNGSLRANNEIENGLSILSVSLVLLDYDCKWFRRFSGTKAQQFWFWIKELGRC